MESEILYPSQVVYLEPGRRCHVANSAGFIKAFDEVKEARAYARQESGAGWLGECWVCYGKELH